MSNQNILYHKFFDKEKSMLLLKNQKKTIIISLVIIFLVSSLYSQDTNQGQAPNQQNAPVVNITRVNHVDLVLNNFDNAEDWRAFATSPLGDTKIQKKVQIGPIQDIYDPTNITQEERNLFIPDQNYVMGVKTYFKDRGFDRVEIKPPHEYKIKGIAKQLSIWVLGRNYRHTLYVKLRDYKGKIHKIKFGSLNFFGWRKLVATIPGWMPQSIRFSLFDRNLRFVSLFVESNHYEPQGTFYFYIDQLVMRVDKALDEYPGSQIRDLW